MEKCFLKRFPARQSLDAYSTFTAPPNSLANRQRSGAGLRRSRSQTYGHRPSGSTQDPLSGATFDDVVVVFGGRIPLINWLAQVIIESNQPLSTFAAALPPPCGAAYAGMDVTAKAKTTMATTTTRDMERNILHPPS